MRVLLCQSYLGAGSSEPQVFPLGLAYLASMIMEKHDLQCFDPNTSEDPFLELRNIFEKLRPDVVGVSLRNVDSVFSFNKRSYYNPFVEIIRTVRKEAPHAKLIVGGTGFSIFAKEIMKKNPEIDVGVVSEGEKTFSDLLENINEPQKVKNLIIRKNDSLLSTGKQELLNFENLPAPSREQFELKKYSEQPFAVGVQSKRGCVFGCIFCPSQSVWGCSFRLRSPKKVVDEIEDLINRLGISSISFAESVFNSPIDYSRKICQEIIDRKLHVSWAAAFNPAFINLESMKEAAKAGCELFSFSPDGASNRSLRLLGKNFDLASVDRTIALTKKIDGVNVGYSFLYDLPFFNGEHVLGLVRLMLKMKSLGSKLSFLSLSKIRVFPRTLIYEIALNQGKISQNTNLLNPTFYESGSGLNPANFIPTALRDSIIVFHEFERKIGQGSDFKFCS